MINKETLHRLVEELPDGELPTAFRFLQYLNDVGEDADEDAFPYARSAMREDDDEYDGVELVEVERDAEQSVADAWQQYFDSKSRSADYGF